MRVWELAEELRISTAELIVLVEPYDKYVTSHLATIPEMALRAIKADPPAPTMKTSDYSWYRPPPPPGPPAKPRRRPRRTPGPRQVSFKPPYEEDDHGYGNDPRADLRYEPFWSTRDVAHYFDVKLPTVRQWVARGYLTPAGKQGPSNIFRNEDIYAAVEAIRSRDKVLGASSRPPAPTPRKAQESALDRLPTFSPDVEVTATEAAAMLGLAPATIRAWVRRGHLKPLPSSGPRQLLFRAEDLYRAPGRR